MQIADSDNNPSLRLDPNARVIRLADQTAATWVYPTVMLRDTRVHSRAVSHSLLSLAPLCFSVRKALGLSRMLP